jgi:meso-butanediol dehydrogenase/(S,S)-butanediol dehydrogenase/diacetyl reductase
MARFDGRVALLTGAGSGIGRATSLRLASEGAKVFGVDINETTVDETAALVKAAGGDMVTKVVDVSDRAQCHDAAADCIAAFGRLDVLGNIAGIARADHFTDMTEETWTRMLGVNLTGVVWMAQAAVPHLLQTDGNIVNIASNAGLMGQAYTVHYCATKGAVVNFTRALAMEYVKTKLRVNAIAPGGVMTTLTQTYQAPSDIDFELMAPYVGHRGMAEASEIAGLFAFLASDDAKSVTGSIYSMDNGVTAG